MSTDASAFPPPPAAPLGRNYEHETAEAVAELVEETEAVAYRRDRLLSSLVFIAGVALFLGAPFALRAGAGFFMPVTVAVVISLVLVPALEWFERRGLPSGLAALLSLLLFLVVANAVIVATVLPATEWVALLPTRLPQIRENLAPVFDAFAALERISDQLADLMGARGGGRPEVVVDTPNSAIDLITQSAPGAFVQTIFALLLVYFFLSTYTRMRERTIRNRASLSGSLRIARMIRDVVGHTAVYILTIAAINVFMGMLVALVVWLLGMPTPLMWGGIAALLNFIPYVGPILTAGLLGFGGLIVFDEPIQALLPAGAFLLIHAIESNIATPAIVGRRLTINPLAILLTLSFWGWVWGTVGALISVPLLIMFKVVLDRVGKPDILGFLFDERTLAESPTE